MDDLLKNLRALARGKHDDFSVVFEAIREIERLQEMEAEIDRYCDSRCVWTDHDEKCHRNTKRDARKAWHES